MPDKLQSKTPDAIDVHVGSRIRLQRRLKGMSQTVLADGLGVTFQQVQKYEKGTNRVGSSRLQAIADILGAPVSFFFEDGPSVSTDAPQFETKANTEIVAFLESDEGIALNRAFVNIQNANVRQKILGLVRMLAKEPAEVMSES
ncbi:helix-turn-helix domain-containing protein [Rhizobium rhizogenes]|uniref:helix-turn-helix domain-containing protein n=1 Tax=Rhizobium rhizogenes TaxID=359 RepID=UPI001D4D9120|nr:helix-turn-helix transcriptional regulator [Rhizobium rhizogenes]NTG97106.1 helix-turn-helix transcriptional regulator [Rhizobium rhizogenes]